jgi:hypothetical protein
MTVIDTDFLKVTVDGHGVVWYLNGDQMPRSSAKSIEAFVDSSHVTADTGIRVVGLPVNAELLIRLFERKLRISLPSLQVCSPLCCESAEERKDPELLLYSMRSFGVSPSLGGWHEFDLKDYHSYTLASHYYRTLGPDDYSRQVMIGHSAWPALSFISGLDSDACSQLLATIIDPRWYIDAAVDPNRGSKLEQFLGLNPKIQVQLGANKSSSLQHARCRLVLHCWKTESPKRPIGPRSFLWRAWAGRGGGYRSDLVASKLFISFLRQTWLQSVCNGPQANHLFVPEYFFVHPDEIVAFKAHMDRRRSNDTD